ncbi:SCP-2 sterol transfer family protein [Ruminococcus sp. YE71]|uniref:SCP2 sterol-binding domain-containing protein n=1 Tax=unclassified Ruminococcus TaxID=2608920 RepID=UPI00087F6D67|nr:MULTISPECIES: SCP2 sterol-binding domain-containing protein [unclassified Ruminococcus]SDA15651.1 SCP-2 sterol transfer family protein [Ruminococcus sp. YE78]SFW22933.1 SCP-2 sterol transfer family protein [Ruminococcus sp. YE71]
MTFDELMTKVKGMSSRVNAEGVGFLAVQVNIKGENGGVFYVEVKDGKVSAEPYEYNDRSCAITMTNEDFNKLIDGELDPVKAFFGGKLKVDGDVGKALEFSKLIK